VSIVQKSDSIEPPHGYRRPVLGPDACMARLCYGVLVSQELPVVSHLRNHADRMKKCQVIII
jgi:hypothetical protein